MSFGTPNSNGNGRAAGGSGPAQDLEKSFNWLRRAARGPTYISYSELSNHAACAFDFGFDGYTASCNYGGELLQITAPSTEHGIAFARGDFEYSLYSSLARGQRSAGGKSTFSLKVASDDAPYTPGKSADKDNGRDKDGSKAENAIESRNKKEDENGSKGSGTHLVLGSMIERGCFNYRWPFNEYTLLTSTKHRLKTTDTKNKADDAGTNDNTNTTGAENGGKEASTCAFFSFVKDGIVYQVLRLEQECRPNASSCYSSEDDCELALTVGGKIKFHLFDSHKESEYGDYEKPDDVAQETADVSPLRIISKDKSSQLEMMLFRLRNDGSEEYDPVILNPGDKEMLRVPQSGTPNACIYRTRIKFPEPKTTAVFVAAFHLLDGNEKVSFPKPPKSEDIYKYVGIAPTSEPATGAMWENIFLVREEKTNAISELSEVSLIARCLEKILHVDPVPEGFGQTYRRDGPLTVVSNIFLQANLDLKALFWKVRFLVKVHNFLKSLQELRQDDSDPEQNPIPIPGEEIPEQEGNIAQLCSEDMLRIAHAQSELIGSRIKRIMLYLVKALLEPGSSAVLMPENFVQGESNYYYVMITVWYVVNKYPDDTWLPKLQMDSWEENRGPLFDSTRLPQDNWPFGKGIRDKVALLKWYHYGSILKLLKKGAIPKAWNEVDLSQKVHSLRTAAKMALAVKVSSKHPYSGENEIVDRLAFLATELGLEDLDQPGSMSGATVAALATRRIKQRDFTRLINPGLLPAQEEGDTGGPWEIHALSHHSRLMVANLEKCDADNLAVREQWGEEVEKFRSKFCEFLTSEATIIPCWERANLTARRGWLRSESTSVLASTLLEICQKDIGIAPEPKRIKRSNTYRKERVSCDQLSVESLLAMQSEALERLTRATEIPPPIEWTRFRPPLQYHPDDFFNSMDDTPHLYKRPDIEKVRIPVAIRNALSPPDHTSAAGDRRFSSAYLCKKPYKPPDLTIDDIKGPEILDLVSVMDIKARARESWSMRVTDTHASQYVVEVAGRIHDVLPIDDLSSPDEQKEESDERKTGRKFDNDDQEKLIIALSDSLVDQEVQHRLIAAKSLPLNLLKLFVYVFHPESVDSLSNHTLKISRFSCQRRDSWVSRITLRSWSLVDKLKDPGNPSHTHNQNGSTDTPEDYLHSSDDEPIFLPQTLKKSLEMVSKSMSKKEEDEPHQVVLKVSSIIISTNRFGNFSKCSVITDLIFDCKLRKLAEVMQELWQKFIHQPQTARCLVFFLILGLLCQEIARRYEDAMNHFVRLLNLGSTFINDEDDWIEDENSVGQVKLGLWGLESLNKLRNTLAVSMRSIDHAKTELMMQINEGPGKRSEQLERMCQEYLEAFERNLGELTAINVKLERKVELNNRYRDALSALLALRDSRNSIKQNSIALKLNETSIEQNKNANKLNQIAIEQNKTIEKLTYLTIGYLPIGLAAAIFAVPDTQNVVFDNMGLGWFIGCVCIFFVLTFTMVVALSTVLEKARNLDEWRREKWTYLKAWFGHQWGLVRGWVASNVRFQRRRKPPGDPSVSVSSVTESNVGPLKSDCTGCSPV